ncbi:MAG: site-2 protease family protein, partial [Deltaproteobacteria bacterium]|nr:site-2 protease family protein [Deltaproteobacteria bacterium]
MFYLLSFFLLLGPLVFVHEFGHFIFAKLFNVRVDVFSMGFGPKIFRKKWGETEYALSVVPLGGYVKLYGQDPGEAIDPHLRKRALNNLDAWKRFLVFVAGPLFNFLFAIFVFAVMLILGEPHIAPVIERVVPGSQAF